MIYNMFFKADKNTMTKETREARLKELRVLQGCDVEAYKDEFIVQFHVDDAKRIKLGLGDPDRMIYNV